MSILKIVLDKVFNGYIQIKSEWKGLPMKFKASFIMLLIILLAMGVTILISGCVSAGESYIIANYKNTQSICPLFIKYVDSDTTLKPIDKKIRIKSAHAWMDLNKSQYERMIKKEAE